MEENDGLRKIRRKFVKTRKSGMFYVERELRRRRRRRLVGYCKRKWYYVWVNGVRMRYDCEWRLASDIAMAKAMEGMRGIIQASRVEESDLNF